MCEGIAKTHLRSVVEEYPQALFSAPESVRLLSVYTQVRHRRHLMCDGAQQDGSIERIQWRASLTIRLSKFYSDSDREVSRTVALNMKTEQYAQLERDQ
jgi:hypothetical protein